MAGIGHNSKRKYTPAEIDAAIRIKIRTDNIRVDSTLMQKARWELWLSRLSPRAKLVGLAIWEHADRDGANASPSMRRLLVMTGGSYRDLVAAIEEFSNWEFSEVIEGSGKRANEYRFLLVQEELSDHLGGTTVVPLRRRDGSAMAVAATTVVAQGEIPNATTVVAQREASATTVVAQGYTEKPVVLPSDPSSATTHISTRASDLTYLGEKEGREIPPEGAFGKIAAAVAATMASSVMPLAAAQPTPVEQVMQGPAECWLSSKAVMAAGMSKQEADAQKQVWVTPTGGLEIAGFFKAEMERMFPLVDMTSALAAACVNVKVDSGAWNALQVVRRQFGFMQQDAVARYANRKPSPVPVWNKKSADDAWLDREIAEARRKGEIA